MTVILLILGLVLFIVLVVVHELGHFFVAKRNGVKAEEFGIFFPPRLWSRKTKNGWDFSINALPLGGFVRLKGEHDADDVKSGYGAAPLKAKVKILLAGVGMNFVVAFILLMVLAWIGMPQLVTENTIGTNQFSVASDSKTIKNEVLISDIEKGSPASRAGLKTNDQLLAISSSKNNSSQNVNNADNLSALTKQYAGQAVTLTIKRGSMVETLNATLRTKNQVTTANAKAACVKNGNGCIGYLGVGPINYTLKRSTWSAPIVAGGLIVQFTDLTVHGLVSAIAGLGRTVAGLATGNTSARQAGQQQATSQITGPIGVYAILSDSASRGYQLVLMIVALISLSLALVNLLPIPALDGGKLYTTLISNLIFRKKVSAAVENWLYGASFALLIVLIVLISISDVHKFY